MIFFYFANFREFYKVIFRLGQKYAANLKSKDLMDNDMISVDGIEAPGDKKKNADSYQQRAAQVVQTIGNNV